MIRVVKNQNKKAMTLTELLVASVLIGLITMGAGAIAVSVMGMRKTTDKASLIVMHSAAVMSRIENTIIRAVGYRFDPGISLNPSAGTPYYSFRTDTDANGSANDTPGDYDDDHWTIFQLSGTELTLCIQDEATGPAPSGACTGNEVLSNDITNLEITACSDAVNGCAGLTDFYIEVILDARVNPNQAADPIRNPEYHLETRINPPSHTF